jgi:hypothetical protein
MEGQGFSSRPARNFSLSPVAQRGGIPRMRGPSAIDAPPAAVRSDLEATRSRRLPAWALSTCLHVALIVTLALTIRANPVGVPGEPQRAVGVVLARSAGEKTDYFDEADANAKSSSTSTQAASQTTTASVLPTPQALPLDLGGVLPSDAEVVDAGGLTGDVLPSASELTSGAGGSRGGGYGGQAKTQVYGLTGQGSKFIYVFDRSGSMSGYGGRPLRSAKAELIASLQDLDRTHQFQIIFYNQDPQVFALRGRAARMEFGDDDGKAAAAKFVQGVVASGGTEHTRPLLMALALRPDVIFFLTDADQPQLSADELAEIQRANKGAQINAIEFGFGPTTGDDNFLKRLARQNGGQHAYVDISKLP